MEKIPFYKFFNLIKISSHLNINKDRLYNNLRGQYKIDSLSEEDKTNIHNILLPAVKAFFVRLGFEIYSSSEMETEINRQMKLRRTKQAA